MKKTYTFMTALLLAAVTLIIPGCKSSAEGQKVLPLTVQGTTLYAGDNALEMHGISFGWHNLWPRFYNGQALNNIHNDWGCRIFRAAIGADTLYETLNGSDHHPGYIEDPQAALNCLYAVVDAAVECGAYIIVDWHSHLIHQKEAEQFFTAVAEKYAGVPNVIYELFNEPVCFSFENGSENPYEDLGNPEAMKAYWAALKAYAEPLVKIIEKANGDYKPLILMGCPSWDQRIDLPAADPIKGYDNLMYTVHFYAGTHKKELRDACDAAIAAGIPVFISECAACDASGNGTIDTESWNEWNRWAAANGITMLSWSVGDKDETCSMFTPEATSEGPWSEEVIKPWGKISKDWIK